MSSDIAIHVKNISKCYQIYDQPQDRLKQSIVPSLQKLVGRSPTNYYRNFWAVRDTSFEVKRGESVGILGRNGSGKSTLLQLITGNLSPTTGSVEVNGRVAALLELGSGFNPEFSGRENVYLNGTLLGLTREQIDDRYDAIAAFADIGQFIEQPVKTYSSGMLVRLAFAVQVQVEPDILIVDEALAVGDALFQKRCFQRIEKLLSDGVTLLFVSHDIESVRTLTHKSLLLNQGTPVSWGLSSDVVLDYRRLLHEQESDYFATLTKQITDKTKKIVAPESANKSIETGVVAVDTPQEDVTARSDKLSFGEGGVEIIAAETFNHNDEVTKIFYPGDLLKIKVVFLSKITIDALNVAVRIRNKEGVKICSWGTLNQDMTVMATGAAGPVFWKKCVNVGDRIEVQFEMPCSLGQNLYEIQAAVSHEKTPNYLNQTMLHWRDEAAFFQVMMKRDEYFFGGVVDLGMTASWKSEI